MGVPRPKDANRKDPRRRPHTGENRDHALSGRDPDRHYVGVAATTKRADGSYDHDDDTLISEYESMGYRIEVARKDGLRFKHGGKSTPDGKPLQRLGHVMMSISNEDKETLDREGADGYTGSKLADIIEESIYGDGGRNVANRLASEGGATAGRPGRGGLGIEVDAERR